ncbi:hypothetical protein L4D00_11230 [Photobacterium swingsii]|uniref:Uncharacterized protein n=1 Tax=Photobacterium swingsii TaxID=680026 RepID=A0A0J8VE53_9GAMM|nr:hypothetical protein [Photobacterium swingsii]KMV31723.1 hypothetical protein AB733_02705 [Photobacterium swingsii]PSW25330.1 hypothetical protein C9I94_06650 [Photobacterium swingsii]
MTISINTLTNSQLRDAKRKAEIWWRAQQAKLKLEKESLSEQEHHLQYSQASKAFHDRIGQIEHELLSRQKKQLRVKPARPLL